MTTYPTIYIDEAGNTGSDILNEAQPYFVLSAIHLTNTELSQIQKDITYDRELHFTEMKKSIKGRATIKQILQHPLMNDEHISFQFVDKQFCTYAQIVDMLIEPVFHYLYEVDLYTKRMNILGANCLYSLCKHHPNQQAVNAFLISFVNMMRHPTDEHITEFYSNVHHLSDISSLSIPELTKNFLDTIAKSRDILEYILIADKFCLDTTLTSLIYMVEYWYSKLNTKLNIIADESKQITAALDTIQQLSTIKDELRTVGYDTRKHVFPLPVNSISMADSNTNLGLQLADIAASTLTFIWNKTTPKYQKFQDELRHMSFAQIPGHILAPASMEELQQDVDDSNDISPIDYLISHLY